MYSIRVLSMSNLCGGKTTAGGLCKRPSGAGTDHVGIGRCKLHGGASIVKHGRYSKTFRGEFGESVKEHMTDPSPLDLTLELSILRAYIDQVMGKVADGSGRIAGDAMEGLERTIGSLQRLADTISKIQTREALTTSELRYIVGEFVEVLRSKVEDADLLREILETLERRIVVRAVPLLEGGV
jgi:hypothetical protein